MKRLLEKQQLCLVVYTVLVTFALIKIFPVKLPIYANSIFEVDMTGYRFILTIIICIFLIRNTARYIKDDVTMSNLLIALINCFYFIPGIIFLTITESEIEYYFFYIGFWLVMLVLNSLIPQSKEFKITFKSDKNKRFLYMFLIVCTTIFSCAISLYLNGFSLALLNILNISSVMDMRLSFREENIHWVIWNFILFSSTVIPIWVIICLKTKKYFIVGFLIFTQISLYSISANRLFLFSLLLAIVIYLFANNYKFIYIFFLLSYIFMILEIAIFDESFIVTDTIRRISYVPNIIGEYYYDFFSHNAPDYLRQYFSRLAALLNFKSKYTIQIPTLIGSLYTGGSSNYNTGLVGAGMGNYGFISIIISPLTYLLSFRILDAILYKLTDIKVKLAIAFILAMVLVNTNQWFESLFAPSFMLLFYISLIIMPMNLTNGDKEQS